MGILCASLFVGCVFKEGDEEAVDSLIEIQFSCISNSESILPELTDKVGLFAYLFDDSDTVFYMSRLLYNASLQKSGSDIWQYTPRQYWPNNQSERFAAFAYSPYASSSNGLAVYQQSDVLMPILHYTVPLRLEDQPELCIASYARENPLTRETVYLNFSKALVQIQVLIEGPDLQVKGFWLKGIFNSGWISFVKLLEESIVWETVGTPTDIDYSVNLDIPQGASFVTGAVGGKSLLKGNRPLRLLPQQIASNASIVLILSDNRQLSFPLNSMATQWKPGGIYTYRIRKK